VSRLCRKSPGKTKKDLRLIQDFARINDRGLLGYAGKVLEKRRSPHADPGLFLDK
jgi:hypothetical protein